MAISVDLNFEGSWEPTTYDSHINISGKNEYLAISC